MNELSMNEFTSLLHTVLALVFVLCLIWLCAFAARRFVPGVLAAGKNRRLQLLEILPLDARHRAVLLRCDTREHLLLVGDGKVCVIDRDLPIIDAAAPKDPAP